MTTRALFLYASLPVLWAGTISGAAAQQNSGAPRNDAARAVVSNAVATAPKEAPNASPPGSHDSADPEPAKNNNRVKNEPAAERIEGEKRYRTNCGRCHVAPEKFPPRAMATIIRHMRVRATITDEDMRLILKYMTQ
jgi:mono/diheme cytochrome c family protein